MLRDESIQITDERYVVTESEACFDELFSRHDVKFVEPHRLEPSPIVLGELLKRRSPPTRQSAFQHLTCRGRVRGGARLLAQQLETACIDRPIRNLKHIARWAGQDLSVGPKDPAQPRKVALEDSVRICWRGTTPQLVAQSVRRDH
jgi:hypothetical protein